MVLWGREGGDYERVGCQKSINAGGEVVVTIDGPGFDGRLVVTRGRM